MTLTTSYWPADTSDEVRPTTVGSVLREAAAEAPDRVAMLAGMPQPDDRTRWTYAELLADAERTARALLTRFEPGEHVAVWAPNIPEWVLLQYGAALAGLVLVTVNPAYQASELEYVLRQSRAVGLFTMPEYRGNPMAKSVESVRAGLPDLRDVVLFSQWPDFVEAGESSTRELPEVEPDDAAALLYTSGTTGFPEGCAVAPPRHHQRLAPGDVALRSAPGRHAGEPDAAVPRRRVACWRCSARPASPAPTSRCSRSTPRSCWSWWRPSARRSWAGSRRCSSR